jgi:hypothetical protein
MHSKYLNCMQAYSTRKLSFTSDALDAFSGIGKTIATELGSQLYFGLPIVFFDWAILWSASFDMVPCNDLPSWSWAAWPGKRLTPYRSPLEQLNPGPWIVWYYDDPDCGVILPLKSLDLQESKSCSRHFGVIARRDSSHVPPGNVDGLRQIRESHSKPPSSFQLYCEGPMHAEFDAQPSPQSAPLQAGTLRFYTLCTALELFGHVFRPTPTSRTMIHGIRDKYGIVCGQIDNRHDIYVDFPAHLTGKQYVIVLSENDNRWSEARYLEMLAGKGVHQEGCGRLYKDFSVMIVDWRDGYAVRKGIGTIRQIALENALERPVWKQIVLR